MGKRNASKYIKLVQANSDQAFISRKPTRPTGKPILETDGWAIYPHRYGPKDNRLWIPVKVVHVAALEGPKCRGVRRTFWLYYGFDACRFRRSKDHRLFQEQAPPAVYEAMLAACSARYTVEAFVARFGETDLAEQRAKLAASTAKRERLTAAHAAALEGDADRALDQLM